MQTLTSDLAAICGPGGLTSRMVAAGDTTLTAGFMWAWRTISPNGPFSNLGAAAGVGPRKPRAYGEGAKVIVMMTDGVNQWLSWPSPMGSVYGAFGYYVDNRLATDEPTNDFNVRSQMGKLFLAACANAKKVGVSIYTVAFTTTEAPIDSSGESLLQSCASKPEMALVASSATDLSAAFKKIAAGVRQLRLTH